MKFYVSFVSLEATPISPSSVIMWGVHRFAGVSITSEIEYGVMK